MKTSTADYFIGLCNNLSKHSKVIVITSKIRETNIALDTNVIIYKWPSPRASKFQDFRFLCDKVRKYKPDTMISIFGFVNMFLIVGKIFKVKHRIAWIRSLSTQFPQKRAHVIRRSLIYRLATQIISNSNATKEDASHFYRIKASKIKVLPNSVKDYSESLRHIPTIPSKFLYVGRLHPTKGVDVLLNAFSHLIKKEFDIHLDIIGDGQIMNELITLTDNLNVSEHVSFMGAKTKEEVLTAYKSSYCTIIPSNLEAFGFTVIEAMSVGTCVIGANNTGIKEIIIHEETGLLFETENSDDLAEKLEKIILDADYRNHLALGGYHHFKNNYENSVAINRDIQFFQNLIMDDTKI